MEVTDEGGDRSCVYRFWEVKFEHTNSSTHRLQQLSVGNKHTSSPIQHLTNDPESSLVKQQSRASITNIAQGDARSVLDDTGLSKVLLWDVPSRNPLPSTLEQPHFITDIRFQPNSTFFAAACFDKIYYCDSTNVSKAPVILKGHTGRVKSIDFSPKDPHILCSCDSQGEILIWDVDTCRTIFKENGISSNQVRFQSGNLLAVASGKKIILLSIHMDSGKIRITSKMYLEGHAQDINSICWDPSNARLASVSHESARVWASTSARWKCVYSLPSGGHVCTSCLFHPLHPQLLIIGTYQYIQLWDTSNGNKSKLFQLLDLCLH
ncbi:transcriptional corepressor LEUNIG_homolog-like protein [Tanacetum coccineum]